MMQEWFLLIQLKTFIWNKHGIERFRTRRWRFSKFPQRGRWSCFLVILFFLQFEWLSRRHCRKNRTRINQRLMLMNAWRLNPNQVGGNFRCKQSWNSFFRFLSENQTIGRWNNQGENLHQCLHFIWNRCSSRNNRRRTNRNCQIRRSWSISCSNQSWWTSCWSR